jgi:hypothetical protein
LRLNRTVTRSTLPGFPAFHIEDGSQSRSHGAERAFALSVSTDYLSAPRTAPMTCVYVQRQMGDKAN